jgi:5-methylthioadenosine/S-adenosylhomocysteine deaminase
MAKIYCARWVLPIASAPIQDGAVAVVGTRIDDLGQRARILFDYPDVEVEDFGDAAILPGFVNSHSHLELTAMRGFLASEEGYFYSWLKKLTVAREERMKEEDLFVSAACGVAEALRAGVTCLGDASSAGATTMRALCEVGARGVVFQEAFGPDPNLATAQFDKLKNCVIDLRSIETELVELGVSPHAPYTVSAPLLELITDYSIGESLPMMMHAAESSAEKALLLGGTGLFADGLRGRGIEWRPPGVSTVQYLDSLGVLRARPLLAHCINVDEEDIALIRENGARIAHCPKSNSKFGHGRAPFASFLSSEIEVGFGSDSVASNNTCDLLEEARFATLLSRSAGDTLVSGGMVGAAEALATATIGGAKALGLGGKIGALAAGFEADLVVVGLGGAHQQPVHDVATTLIASSSGRDVVLTMVAGREVFRDGHLTTIDESELLSRLRITASRLYKN